MSFSATEAAQGRQLSVFKDLQMAAKEILNLLKYIKKDFPTSFLLQRVLTKYLRRGACSGGSAALYSVYCYNNTDGGREKQHVMAPKGSCH